MMHMRRFALAVVAAALAGAAAPRAARAQATLTIACQSGIGCDFLQFGFTTTSPFQLDDLQLTLSGGTWRFVPAGGPGTYVAQDHFGPSGAFGGFSTIDATGGQLFINFLDNGFPFELAPGDNGFVQAEGSSTNPAGLVVSYLGHTPTGGTISGRAVYGQVLATPEPVTFALMGTGLAGLGVVARWRRRTAA